MQFGFLQLLLFNGFKIIGIENEVSTYFLVTYFAVFLSIIFYISLPVIFIFASLGFGGRIVLLKYLVDPPDLKLSSITVAELYYGAEKSRAKKKNWAILDNFTAAFEIIPFDAVCGKIYANIRASLEKSGTPIGPMDLLIAAICLHNNFILVTNNTNEFRRIKKIKLENWL